MKNGWIYTENSKPTIEGQYLGYHISYPRDNHIDVVEYIPHRNLWKRRQEPLYWMPIPEKTYKWVNPDQILKTTGKDTEIIICFEDNRYLEKRKYIVDSCSLKHLGRNRCYWDFENKGWAEMPLPPTAFSINNIEIIKNINRFELMDLDE